MRSKRFKQCATADDHNVQNGINFNFLVHSRYTGNIGQFYFVVHQQVDKETISFDNTGTSTSKMKTC